MDAVASAITFSKLNRKFQVTVAPDVHCLRCIAFGTVNGRADEVPGSVRCASRRVEKVCTSGQGLRSEPPRITLAVLTIDVETNRLWFSREQPPTNEDVISTLYSDDSTIEPFHNPLRNSESNSHWQQQN